MKQRTTNNMEHNPDELSKEQYGASEGWRLLDEGEISAQEHYQSEIEGWYNNSWDDTGWEGSDNSTTYRTRLTRAELAEKRGIKPSESKPHCAFCGGESHTLGECPIGSTKEKLARENATLKLQLSTAKAEIVELSKDRERMNWMEKNTIPEDGETYKVNALFPYNYSVRDAIDLAIKTKSHPEFPTQSSTPKPE